MHRDLILLVEDNADDEALTLRALRRLGIRCEVVVARDGVEALEWLFGTGAHAGRDTSVQPQLVLLDLSMPRLSGLQVLEAMQADPRTRLVPACVLTSSGEDVDVLRAYALGANSYVKKPVDFREFVEVIKRLGKFWLEVNETAPATGRPATTASR